MSRADPALPLRHAVALGLLQGPTELLPVSSSAHTTLLPWLARWPYAELDGELRKSFEVALHTGAGLALAASMRTRLFGEARALDARSSALFALALAPPALAGYLLRPKIERLLGRPGPIALGLLAGGVAMAFADARSGPRPRDCEQAGAGDALALGLAQAAALAPGVSRSGAALTAARSRGFTRAASESLSWAVALPVIAGASLLEILRLMRGDAPAQLRGPLAAGALSAFCSTLASEAVLRRRLAQGRSLLPFVLYRCLLAAVVLGRLRRGR